jgi:hypothetical protein
MAVNRPRDGLPLVFYGAQALYFQPLKRLADYNMANPELLPHSCASKTFA